jgi:hypothetical protein
MRHKITSTLLSQALAAAFNRNAEAWKLYAERVRKLEEEGLCTSDAQAVVDAEMQKEKP